MSSLLILICMVVMGNVMADDSLQDKPEVSKIISEGQAFAELETAEGPKDINLNKLVNYVEEANHLNYQLSSQITQLNNRKGDVEVTFNERMLRRDYSNVVRAIDTALILASQCFWKHLYANVWIDSRLEKSDEEVKKKMLGIKDLFNDIQQNLNALENGLKEKSQTIKQFLVDNPLDQSPLVETVISLGRLNQDNAVVIQTKEVLEKLYPLNDEQNPVHPFIGGLINCITCSRH